MKKLPPRFERRSASPKAWSLRLCSKGRDALQGGEAHLAHDGEEVHHPGGFAELVSGGGIEGALQAVLADGPRHHVLAVQERLHGPSGHGGNGLPAGDQLQDGDGQLRGPPPGGINAGGNEHLTHHVEPVIGDRVGDQRLSGEVLGGQEGFLGQCVLLGQERRDFVSEQRMKSGVAPLQRVGNDHQIRPVFVQQPNGIGMEAGHQILLHFRPALAKGIHGRHQPVKAGMALHRDAQLAGVAAGDAGQVTLGLGHLLLHDMCEKQHPLAGGGQLQRHGLALEQRHSTQLLQGLHLVRHRGLAQVQPGRRFGQAVGLSNG